MSEICLPLITSNNEMMGAVFYEKPATGQVLFNWYLTKLHTQMDPKDFYYPQEPIEQSWIADYPVLAYKCMSPDNKEIALVHLAQ